MILITPDAQRTMNTFLGASIDLSPDDIDAAAVARAAIVYLEGYLWDKPRAKDAMRKAMRLSHEAGRKVAMSLSADSCGYRPRDEFHPLAEHPINILFAH